MEHQWTMGEEDFLTYQLHHFKSSGKLKKIQRYGFIWLGASLLFAFFGWMQGVEFIIIYGLVFGLYMALFYFVLYKRRLLKHFTKHVREHYQERFEMNASLKFGIEWIFMTDDFSELKVKLGQIQHFTELPEHILIKLKYGETVIIPKKKVATMDELYVEIEKMSDREDVPFFKQSDWKW